MPPLFDLTTLGNVTQMWSFQALVDWESLWTKMSAIFRCNSISLLALAIGQNIVGTFAGKQLS
jgi:hypothetical protein